MKKDDKLSWGILLLFFGILYLLKVFAIVPSSVEKYVFDIANFPIVAGIIFFIFNKNKRIGIAFLVMALLMRFDYFIHLVSSFPIWAFPVILIVLGIILIWGIKGGK